MKVIIMGCGRVGEQVSRIMVEEGQEVTVIDQDPAALARLGPKFKGQTVKGVGFDRNVLIEAGIEQADAFAATSSSDNANIVAARIARNIFHVPRVVARLFDPQRAEIYRRLGLVTISSTTWGAQRIYELLTHSDLDPEMTFGRGEVAVITIETPPQIEGRMVRDLTVAGEIIVAAITRNGVALIPMLGSQFQAGDSIHLVILSSALDRLYTLLGLA
jgi:trk system potassium uptake protein TrkA